MIDSVQFVLTDGMNLYELPKLGGNGGTHAEWDVPYGEFITKKFQSDTTNNAVVFSSSLIQESSLLSSENK